MIAFISIQSVYFEYMALIKPHSEMIHNKLEFVNEGLLIAIQYMMIIILLAKEVGTEYQWATGFTVSGLVALIFLINISVLVYLNIRKIKVFLRLRRLKR